MKYLLGAILYVLSGSYLAGLFADWYTLSRFFHGYECRRNCDTVYSKNDENRVIVHNPNTDHHHTQRFWWWALLTPTWAPALVLGLIAGVVFGLGWTLRWIGQTSFRRDNPVVETAETLIETTREVIHRKVQVQTKPQLELHS